VPPPSSDEPPSGGPEVLRVQDLSVSFEGKAVLEGLDLVLRAGENLAILGLSGSGKSVFLKIIIGLLEPDAGDVYLWGKRVNGLNEDDWTPLRRRMGMVFQAGALFDSLSVFENVAFPLRERKLIDENKIRSIVEERLEWVGLPGTGDLAPSQLSGGMRRRLALARTLAGEPEFVLYDEPTAGLDPVTGRKISSLMRDLDTKLRTTSILVTHDIESARTVSTRWAFLSRGRVLADGSPEELFATEEPEVKEFLMGPQGARKLLSRDVEP